jgi:hypothetical protein
MSPAHAAMLLSLLGTALDKAYAAYQRKLQQGVTEAELNELVGSEEKRSELLLAEYDSYGSAS